MEDPVCSENYLTVYLHDVHKFEFNLASELNTRRDIQCGCNHSSTDETSIEVCLYCIYKYGFVKHLIYFKRLHVKSEGVWCLSFQEEYLSMGWRGNLDSSMVNMVRGSNPGPGSNFSPENLICKFYKA